MNIGYYWTGGREESPEVVLGMGWRRSFTPESVHTAMLIAEEGQDLLRLVARACVTGLGHILQYGWGDHPSLSRTLEGNYPEQGLNGADLAEII